MVQQLSGMIPLAVALLLGIVGGTIFSRLALKHRIQTATIEAKSDSQLEIARLTERVSSVNSEVARQQAQIGDLEAKLAKSVGQLDASKAQCAQLAERASRIPSLESQVSSLQTRVQQESARASSLAEQAARVPELQQSQQNALLEIQQLNKQTADLREKWGASESKAEVQRKAIERAEAERAELSAKRDHLLQEQEALRTKLAELSTVLAAEREQTTEKLALLDKAKEQLSDTFKSLASEILEEKSIRFTEQNKTNIGQILEPLGIRLREFQIKVEQVYVQESKDRSALGEQVKQLMSLSQRVSSDAKSLADALKGSSKTQGNWGELVLERVLEASGLRRGHEYELRETYWHEDGHKGQPDVVIFLPEERHLVIDAKVSLKDYEESVNAESDTDRRAAVDRHLASVRRHMKELSEKDYQALHELNSLDFVIMFVPVEPAFALAIAEDSSLWEEAWKRNVLLVSPSTLLFVLRTVAYLWRQEDQARNVQEIANRGAELYDKLVGFVADVEKIGERLEQAKESYDSALNKLSKGNGNVIRRAEKLKELGVTPSKSLPSRMVEIALEEPLVLPSLAPVEKHH
ncbi:MAG: DNA recombination protein RmuC [Terriglobales bacterium]|jgi:DNA recombination protein RmuC